MFRLTREVRFAVNDQPDAQLRSAPANSYGGYPSLTGFGHYLTLAVTLEGELNPSSNYLRNIKEIDDVVRRKAIGLVSKLVQTRAVPAPTPALLFDALRDQWPGTLLCEIRLGLSPFLSLGCLRSELPMIRLSQKFEFAASHRLHNPSLSDEQNRATFGKCNNPHGHGHNYELQVTLKGNPNDNGLLIDVPTFEKIVSDVVISRFDHKNLNIELPEFTNLIPSVENIARVIHQLLKPQLQRAGATLSSITVWETPKTWCEYSE
jgi:6-pyruvoyltetrahydropterin/6-carboxytetrahydropterin synthase